MRAFFNQNETNCKKASEFDQYINSILNDGENGDLNYKSKKELLSNWKEHKYAEFCHPTDEHLNPLFVAFGSSINNGKSINIFKDTEM